MNTIPFKRNGKNGKRPEKRRHVDFLNNPDDYECALLGAFGFSTGCILGKTDLTPGQVTYRLKRAEISRMEFRNGTSPFAQLMLRHARSVGEPKLLKHLRTHVPASHADVARAA